jgi:ATP-dependent Clp protease ATP-binding subunit ClpC
MGAAMDLKLHFYSMRSQKARISVIFNKTLLVLLAVSVVALLILGVMLLVLESAAGWAFIGLASVPAMIVEWYNGELKHIPVSKNPKTIDDMLSGEVLGRLSKNPSPREVAEVVSRLPGGYFFAVRFGIGSRFLQELTSSDSADMQKVWANARDLQKQTNSKNISAAILIVAMIHSTTNYQTLISHLQLDDDDLLRGIEWYDHLRQLIERHRAPKRTGGVARDWSFGWTPMLNRFGIQMGGDSVFDLIAHEESLDQLMGIFSKNGRQNVVLVGQPGVGKTEIVNAFASRLLDANAKVPSNLRFRQVYSLDAASLIAAAPDRGGLEQLIPRVLGEAYSSKNIIICLDNAQLFFEDGIGSVDITNVLLPILKAGNLRMILTVDEQRFLQIGKRNPELVNALNRVVVPPASRDETIKIMQDQTVILEFQNNVTFMYQALVEAYRLGDRYVHDQAMPGKAIKLLESSANYSDSGLVSAESVRQSIEKTMDIKVSLATDADEREKLLNLEELIHGRMINQVRAVNVVSDALRRARAGVRNLNRPIGTFLFLGPTGVGKTELAKSLAEIYFKGEDRIIRVDMNEYVGADDVNRLIADGADNANSLTAQVMKQPFSVILLDEIEKAHTNVMSTLLQMLDEGILRDIKNREVSFRDAIIVATSNAGADRIREYIDRGYDIQQFEDKFVDELISSNQFRPELLNRFDEIVMFRPLNKTELLKVVDLMIGSVNKTLALQKVSVKVADDAKEYLVEAGYDPRLGARPMRRVVQRAVENTVAKQMLSGAVEPGSTIEISLEQVSQIIDSKIKADEIVEEEKVD